MVSPVGGTRVQVVSVQGVAETALHWGGGWSERRRRRRRFHAGDTSPMRPFLVCRRPELLEFRESYIPNGLLTVSNGAQSMGGVGLSCKLGSKR
jgi:hypothetical protein